MSETWCLCVDFVFGCGDGRTVIEQLDSRNCLESSPASVLATPLRKCHVGVNAFCRHVCMCACEHPAKFGLWTQRLGTSSLVHPAEWQLFVEFNIGFATTSGTTMSSTETAL